VPDVEATGSAVSILSQLTAWNAILTGRRAGRVCYSVRLSRTASFYIHPPPSDLPDVPVKNMLTEAVSGNATLATFSVKPTAVAAGTVAPVTSPPSGDRRTAVGAVDDEPLKLRTRDARDREPGAL